MEVRGWCDAVQALVSLYWLLCGDQVRAGRELSAADCGGDLVKRHSRLLVMMMKKLHIEETFLKVDSTR